MPFRVRTRVTKGSDSRVAELAMIFKLLLTVAQPWRKLNGAKLVPRWRA